MDKMLMLAGDSGAQKVSRKLYKQLLLAFLGGAFIAFASEGANMAAFNLLASPDTYGLGRFVAGLVFGTGLMLVIIAGGELFTGNMLIIIPLLQKKIRLWDMLKNWLLVYAGNFIGALCIAWMMAASGLFNSGGGLLGGVTIKIAFNKIGLSFGSAFLLGLMGNWLVCLAVWMSYAAKDIAGKITAIFFVVGLFVISGFEHSIANMYYLPAALLAKTNSLWAGLSGLTGEQLSLLNWPAFLVNNLLPVTLGNMVGGVVLVGCFYWLAYGENRW